MKLLITRKGSTIVETKADNFDDAYQEITRKFKNDDIELDTNLYITEPRQDDELESTALEIMQSLPELEMLSGLAKQQAVDIIKDVIMVNLK